jgi:hypothetical protein
LIGLNLLVILTALPVVTAGVGVLAGYWWTARVARDEDGEGLGVYFLAARRFFWRGVLVSLVLAVWLGLMYANLLYWPRVLPELLSAVLIVTWLFASLTALAALPVFLEQFVVQERPAREALLAAGLGIALYPLWLYSHAVLALLLVFVATRFHTLAALVLLGALLVLAAVSADGAPQRGKA